MGVKFGIQIRSDWPLMGQIWDFFRSVSVHFGFVQTIHIPVIIQADFVDTSQNVLKLILKVPDLSHFGGQTDFITHASSFEDVMECIRVNELW